MKKKLANMKLKNMTDAMTMARLVEMNKGQ